MCGLNYNLDALFELFDELEHADLNPAVDDHDEANAQPNGVEASDDCVQLV